MYAYAPDGSPIVSTKETIPGTCHIDEDSFEINGPVDAPAPGGAVGNRHALLSYAHNSGTDVEWNGQKSLVDHGQTVFLDEADRAWPACAIVLTDGEIDPDSDDEDARALPADQVAIAKASYQAWRESRPFVGRIDAPDGRWPDVSSLTPAEVALLSPIAATLAMLSGRSAAEIAGDPSLVTARLGQAKALATREGATVGMLADSPALYTSRLVPLPSFVRGREVVDLVDGAGTTLVELTDVEWDHDGEGADLPTSMIAAVDDTWHDDNGIVDMLSDHFGFCVSGIGSTVEVDRSGAAVDGE